MSFKGILIALMMLTITVGIGNASHQRSEAPTSAGIALRINEFMADNTNTLPDPANSSSYPDWIELYNSGTLPVNLNGLYLTDDLGDLTQFQINEFLVLGPQEFVLFYADNDPEEGPRHLNFRLSSDGEMIALVDIDGTTILDSYTFGPQQPDISEGRSPDGSNTWLFFDTPTPGMSNHSNPQSLPPIISNTSHQPAIPTASESVTVRTTIIDDGIVASATLYYSIGGSFIPTPMTSVGNNQYQAIIPASADQTQVRYYVMAQDDELQPSFDPSGAPIERYGYTVGYSPPPLYVNEFMADNQTGLIDPVEPTEYPDWFEIYNGGTLPVDLNGYYLTDDLTQLTQYQITAALVIPAQGFLLFYADNDAEQGIEHTNFGLNNEGDTLALVDRDGLMIIDSYTFGAQQPDISEGRSPDGSENWGPLDTPTPGMSNQSNPQPVPPIISNTSHQPAIPSASESVTVRTTMIDDGAVSSATLYYATGGDFTTIAMTSLGNNEYEAMIPALADQTPVRYYVMAQDDEALVTVDPSGAPTQLYGYTVGYSPPPLYVNEFMANNQTGLIDPVESDEFPDWFELYNGGEAALDLNGYYLTDDLTQLTQYQITDTLVIPAQGFLLFYADNDAEQGIEHTNFGLNNAGETLALVDKDGLMIVDSYTFGSQSPDLSEGRLPDGSQSWLKFSGSTPNESNSLGLALSHQIFLPLIMN